MSKFSKYWSDMAARWALRRYHRLQKTLSHNSNDAIQLMEFNGATYLSHNGVPVVCTDYLNSDVVGIIGESRKTWIDFKLREINLNRHPQERNNT